MPSARLLVSEKNLIKNLTHLTGYVHGREIYPVVKANAYGHGILEIVEILQKQDIKTVCVAKAFEGALIRKAFKNLKILIFEPAVSKSDIKLIEDNALIPTVTTKSQLESLSGSVALMLETGFNRYGASIQEGEKILKKIKGSKNLKLHSIYSHLSSADSPDDIYKSIEQISAIDKFAGRQPHHILSSAGILNFTGDVGDAVRAGAILYGAWPTTGLRKRYEKFLNISPVGTLQGLVTEIKKIKKGEAVGYGDTWTATQDCYIAVIAAGYAYGVPRNLSNKGSCLIDGEKYPIIGRVSMDSCQVLLGETIKNYVYKWATFWGTDEFKNILPVDEVSETAGTCPHEVLSAVPDRVDRVYL